MRIRISKTDLGQYPWEYLKERLAAGDEVMITYYRRKIAQVRLLPDPLPPYQTCSLASLKYWNEPDFSMLDISPRLLTYKAKPVLLMTR